MDFISNWHLIFLAIFMMVLSLGLFIAGIFTVYFGSGKSRAIGGGLLGGGIAIGAILMFFFYQDIIFESPDIEFIPLIKNGLVYLIAALVGGLAAVGAFLLAIMKS